MIEQLSVGHFLLPAPICDILIYLPTTHKFITHLPTYQTTKYELITIYNGNSLQP
jgi:hypothetical protein